MERDIRARVEKLAPFLRYDGHELRVAIGNRTICVLDGYTTTCLYALSDDSSVDDVLAEDFIYFLI